MEQREAGQREQHQARRRDPVVDARAGRVAVDRDRVARMDVVARLHIICALMTTVLSASSFGVLLVLAARPGSGR